MKYTKGDVITIDYAGHDWILVYNCHDSQLLHHLGAIDPINNRFNKPDSWGGIKYAKKNRYATQSEITHLNKCKREGKYLPYINTEEVYYAVY